MYLLNKMVCYEVVNCIDSRLVFVNGSHGFVVLGIKQLKICLQYLCPIVGLSKLMSNDEILV